MEYPVFDSISRYLHPVFPWSLLQLSKHFLCCSLKTAHPGNMISVIKDCCNDFAQDNDDNDKRIAEEEEEEEEEEEVLSYRENHTHELEEKLTNEDINTVMRNLCVEGFRNIEKQDDKLIRDVYDLLDNKNASLEELEEAFYVFDRNEDGFITPFELWSVLRRLRLMEGMRYEDCEQMIKVFDKDGDGRISFSEFKHMMESAF